METYVMGSREKRLGLDHYENMPIQIYWNFYHRKMKNFR